MMTETRRISSVMDSDVEKPALTDPAWLFSQKSMQGRRCLACLIKPDDNVHVLSCVGKVLEADRVRALALWTNIFPVLQRGGKGGCRSSLSSVHIWSVVKNGPQPSERRRCFPPAVLKSSPLELGVKRVREAKPAFRDTAEPLFPPVTLQVSAQRGNPLVLTWGPSRCPGPENGAKHHF